mmetsp:Transcript_27941/g.65157  ORF Transcript_27941/g.65157 Transcript_27941/m.65157 type:complete len:260 (+) Transcript_27941:315-1094(+)
MCVRVGLHNGQLAPRAKLQIPDAPAELAFVEALCFVHLGEVRVRWERKPVPVKREDKLWQCAHLGAVRTKPPDRVLQDIDNVPGHHQQGGAAVNDGSAAPFAPQVPHFVVTVVGQVDIRHVHSPSVPANDGHAAEERRIVVGARVIPNEEAAGAGPLSQAEGEEPHFVLVQQRLVAAHFDGLLEMLHYPVRGRGRREDAVVQAACDLRHGLGRLLPEVVGGRLRRTDADDRLELGALKDGHVCVVALPEGQVDGVEGAY